MAMIAHTRPIVIVHRPGDTGRPTPSHYLSSTDTGGLTMRQFRTRAVIGLLARLSVVALHAQPAMTGAPNAFQGGTYLVTFTDATTGAFASRRVVALQRDGTLSAINSAQGGPTFFFTSELGAWEPDRQGGAVGRTLDFNLPPTSPGVVRLDYTFTFSANNTQVTGTITLTSSPLQGNPLGAGGTVFGELTFTGTLVEP